MVVNRDATAELEVKSSSEVELKVEHHHRKRRLLLCAPPSEWEGKPSVVLGEIAKPVAKAIEHAGHCYHSQVVKLLREEEDYNAVEDAFEHHLSSAEKGPEKARFICDVEGVQHADPEDYYAVLGISHLSRAATVDHIRKAYRKVSLYYHPDKNALQDLHKSDKVFKSIQTAYDTLMDTRKREIYDSTIPFDDSIPNPDLDADFYDLYQPVFERNAVFSSVQPVPSLGDSATPFETVDKFYDFWFSFRSWREFPQEEQYDLEEAECREERRWMERQNAKIQAAAKRDESARIRKLVEQAMARDPRIIAYHEEEKQKQLAKKQAKLDQKKKKQEEEQEKQKAKQLVRQREMEIEAEKKEMLKRSKENVKRLQKKIRRKLNSWTSEYPEINEEAIKQVVGTIPVEQLEDFTAKLEDGRIDVHAILRIVETTEKKESEEESKEPHDQPIIFAAPSEPISTAWTPEEFSLLTKAVTRYPGGTVDRWEKVAGYVKTRTVEEVMAKAKELRKTTKKVAGEPVKATAVSTPSTPQRASTASKPTPSTPPKNNVKKTPTKPSPPQESKPETPRPAEPEEQEDAEWSDDLQKRFETALRLVPKEHPERWDEIAKLVPGKTKKDCVRRFKEIRALLMKK